MFWRKQEAVSVFILGNQANSWILNISNSGNLSSIFSIPLLYRSLLFLLLIPLWYSGFHGVTSDFCSRAGFFFHVHEMVKPGNCKIFETIWVFDLKFHFASLKRYILSNSYFFWDFSWKWCFYVGFWGMLS